MSNPHTYKIVKGSDLQYINGLKTLTDHPVGKQFTHVKISYFLQGEKSVQLEASQNDEELTSLLQANAQLFRVFQLTNQNRTIQILRHSDQLFDDVSLNPGLNQNPMSPTDTVLLLAHLQSVFPPTSAANLGPLLGEDVKLHIAAREDALSRLEGMSAKILFDLADQKRKLDTEFHDKERHLEDKFVSKNQELEEEYAAKQSALNARETELEKTKAELDDRSSTHARRDIRKELKAMISKPDRLKVSTDTRIRRAGIIAVYVVLLIGLGVPAARFLSSASQTAGFDPWTFGRQVAFSIGFVVTAGFFLRWLNQWSQQLAQEELRQKQFELDIDRASWLVEMSLEWKSEKGTEIPEHLLSKLSSNLFENKQAAEDVSMTAADALASAILGSASKAKVTLPGGEIELDRRGISKLQGTDS